MLKINEENKKFWDDTFAQVPPTRDEDCCCECSGKDDSDDEVECCCGCCCEDEDGNWKPAVPLGYDDDMKEYSAVKDLTEDAIKNRTYRCWKVGSYLVESYCENPEELRLYDVLFLFTESWEEPLFTVLLTGIDEENHKLKVMYIDNNKDKVIKADAKYTPPVNLTFNDKRTLPKENNLDPRG